MSKKRTIVYAVLLFISGLILGASIIAAGVRFRVLKGIRGPRPPMPVVIMERLDRELDLRPEQKDGLRSIVEELDMKFQAMRLEARPRMEGIIDEAEKQAEPILDEEQRGKLKKIRERARDHFERRRERQ